MTRYRLPVKRVDLQGGGGNTGRVCCKVTTLLVSPLTNEVFICLSEWVSAAGRLGQVSTAVEYSRVQYIIQFLKVMYLVLTLQVPLTLPGVFLRQIQFFSEKTPRI